MKKIVGFIGVAVLVLIALSGCQTLFGRGRGPVASFAFLPQYNPGLSRPVTGRINESAYPKIIEVVVPPRTDTSHLVATFSFNTEATISVISSGQNVAQTNSQTSNNFQSPVLYSIKTAKDKEPWQYRVMVREADQNALLSQVRVVDGTPLNPAFNPNTKSYTTTVPYGSSRVTIEAAAQSPHLEKMTIGGHEARGPRASVAIPFTGVDRLSVPITTVAEDQTTSASYTLNILRGEPDRNSALASLSVGNAAIRPAFSPARLSYLLEVPYPTKTLDVKAVPQSKYATVALATSTSGRGTSPLSAQGNPTAGNGARIDFAAGQQLDLVVVVTAQDGSTSNYTVTVLRAAPDRNNLLAELQVPNANIAPAFDPRRLQYNVEVPFSAKDFAVVAPPQSAHSSVVIVGGRSTGNPASADGATIQFAGVSSAAVTIQVTAQDGSIRTYRLVVRRGQPDSNSRLATLLVTPGTLSPQFSSRTVTYNAVIPGNVPTASITVQTASPYASVATSESGVKQSGSAANGMVFTVPVAPAQTRAVDLTVTAQDGSQRLYRVSITREAAPAQPAPKEHNSRLSGIVIAGGELAPGFSPSQLTYEVKVPTSQNRVSIFPIAESPKAEVSVDGQAAGNSARTIQLKPGSPQIVVIQVKAEDGTQTRYTVTMTRELPRTEKPSSEEQKGKQPQAGSTGSASGREAAGGQQTPSGQAVVQQPSATPQAVGATVTVKSDGVRVDPRVWKDIRDARDEIGSQAIITIRPEGSNEVLLQGTVPIQIRQPGNSPPEITFNWQSQSFSAPSGQRVTIEVAIPTRRGWYVDYTDVAPVQGQLSVTVPNWSYDKSLR